MVSLRGGWNGATMFGATTAESGSFGSNIGACPCILGSSVTGAPPNLAVPKSIRTGAVRGRLIDFAGRACQRRPTVAVHQRCLRNFGGGWIEICKIRIIWIRCRHAVHFGALVRTSARKLSRTTSCLTIGAARSWYPIRDGGIVRTAARSDGVAPSCCLSGEGAASAAIAIMSEALSAIDAARGAIELNCSYEVATICLAMSPSDSHATATATATPTQNVIGRPRSQESAWHSSLFPVRSNATSFATNRNVQTLRMFREVMNVNGVIPTDFRQIANRDSDPRPQEHGRTNPLADLKAQ
jgi:hypothetical protein